MNTFMKNLTLKKILFPLHTLSVSLFVLTILSIIFINYFRGGYSVLLAVIGLPIFSGLLIPCIFIYIIIGVFKLTGRQNLKYSNYNYQGKNKLYPVDKNFINNETWTEKRLNHFWYNYWLACSQYNYEEDDRLTPLHQNFIQNDTWSIERREIFYEKCLKRSQYGYKYDDKIFPDEELFVPNSTWSQEKIENYYWNKY